MQKTGRSLDLVDPKLGTEFNEKEAQRMIKVALLCVNASPKLRPTMSAAIRMLEGKEHIPEEISDPSIYGEDLKIISLRNQNQHVDIQNSSGILGPYFSSDGTQVPSSSASAHDLYHSSQVGETSSLGFHKNS